MSLKLVLLVILLVTQVASEDTSFIYNGFQSSHLYVDGIAELTSNGLLRLTNDTKQQKGHAFYPSPIVFKNTFNGSVSSFSTTFVFAIRTEYPTLSGHGIVFVVSPTKGLPNSLPSAYLGLFDKSNNGNDSNHVFGVELDTILNSEFADINDNHVGIAMQVWVEYDGVKKQIDVTLAPINIGKPERPLLSLTKDLSPILNNIMYVGFSSSTGSVLTSHYVLGWSFKVNGQAQQLAISELPKLPRLGDKKEFKFLTAGLPLISVVLVLMITLAVVFVIKRKKKFAEVLEDWEQEYGPHRFKFKDLYFATKGFKEKELLGTGGFGRVYKGVMPISKIEVAVKKVSHESRQGMREFVSEIVSIGRLRHRNLVSLLGYCRRKGELLLVYEYMPNGSLDKYLYNQPTVTLTWSQRFRIIKGVASGLFYLHEEWEQVVVHRDIKASNVLLDAELNGRLGDFGLARLYDHGTDPQTTHVVGTLGYLAPEHTRTGKATTSSDVFAFGAFLLEVVCGKRPIEHIGEHETRILVDWVYACGKRGEILEAKDVNLGIDYRSDEVELVLKLGLLCSHSEPLARPSMRQVVQHLEMDEPLPDLSLLSLSSTGLTFGYHEDSEGFALSYPSSMDKPFTHITNTSTTTTTSIAESFLSSGR
ncbi:L-type lectin-domain containing receptor kinase IV.1-like isoform X2 [Gastrolobium bilobum]|uniref:L-type lectin-domain containing receptor kinase IV.1-like isoform X2 n=1 Tax=Gastrolobium bilobum TaxID=150636 RepID=UPI002AB25A57|nr:L-type lectin-domain containing receptor kinase IV.1-like isoform X2 [Gastrolobium bilobum]